MGKCPSDCYIREFFAGDVERMRRLLLAHLRPYPKGFKPCMVCGRPRPATSKSRENITCHRCRSKLTRAQKVALGIVNPPKRYPDKSYDYKKTPCSCGCGELAWISPTPPSDGMTFIKGHRPGMRIAAVEIPCLRPGCTAAVVKPENKFCSIRCCGIENGRRRRGVWADGSRQRRADRERDTPGIRPSERDRLRRKWKAQRRTCFYGCGRSATTIDHVIPLVMGGTNYEGNLVPCCKSCNSSKQDKLPIEFKLWRQAQGGGVDSLAA